MGVVTVWVACVSCITRVTSTVVTVIKVRGSENWGSHRSRGKFGMISSLSLSKSGSKYLFGSLDLGGVFNGDSGGNSQKGSKNESLHDDGIP